MPNEIVFPITLDYVAHWSDDGWPIIRELVTNAMDTDPGFRMSMGLDEGERTETLFIHSKGANLAIRHLLFGVSEKNGANAIGQFGEGLKLALLALTREGLTANIYTGGMHLWNRPAELYGEQVFSIVWEDYTMAAGGKRTTIEIADWPYKTFEERFVRPGDPRILFTDPFGRSILEEDPPGIYVKGVWVQPARGHGRSYTFGYNLTDVEMNRDRGVVDSWNVNAETGKIWASVSDPALLRRFWQAVKDQMAEKSTNMHGCNIADKTGMRQAFQSVYGKDAVIAGDSGMQTEATYRGAKVITGSDVGGFGLKDIVSDLVGTDAEYVAEMEGGDRMYLPDKRLSEHKLKVLNLLRRMGRRIGSQAKISAYILPDGILGECHKNHIRISLTVLETEHAALCIWLHEEAHRDFKTADATAEHVAAVAKVAARVIITYARRR